VGVWRTDHSTVVVRFKRRLLGWHLNSYGWRVISVYDEPQGGCTKDDKGGSPNGSYEVASSLGPPFCVDYVPGRKRYVRHRGL
jgi:hypothetical protein